jgi:hypothetical protein
MVTYAFHPVSHISMTFMTLEYLLFSLVSTAATYQIISSPSEPDLLFLFVLLVPCEMERVKGWGLAGESREKIVHSFNKA